MNRALAFGYVLGLFLLGIVIGALGMRVVESRRPPMRAPREFHDPLRRFETERLAERLDLSARQRREIRAILDEAREEGEALRREIEPRVRAHFEDVEGRIRALLTEDQRERFDEMRSRRRRPGRRPPPGE